jgi:NitT/TauT family transport system substrate-binding protein
MRRGEDAMKFLLGLMALVVVAVPTPGASAQETLKYGAAVTLTPVFYLPVLAAEERGIFKKNGVDIEWFPSRSGTDMQRALAASAIKIGSSGAAADILSIARGVPVVIVGNLQSYDDFAIWVSPKGRLHKPEDLKGAKLGVSRFGGLEHSYGLLVAQQLGLTKDIQFVSTGGINESLAVMETGGIDGVVLTPANVMNLMLQGKVASLLEVKDYLPKSWAAYTIVARKDFVDKEPDTAKKVVHSIFEANRFLASPEAKPWVLAKMREVNGYSEEGAELLYNSLHFSPDGAMPADALKNVTKFMVEHDLMKEAEVPPTDSIFTDRLLK